MELELVAKSDQKGAPNLLMLRRYLEKGKTSITTRCLPGIITVLQDEIGTALPEYMKRFAKKHTRETVIIELDGVALSDQSASFVGFDEKLPDLSIPQYFLSCGINEEEIENVLQEFELKSQTILMCSQLSMTYARQVQLIAAMKSETPVIIMNDPFQPFNGRWREVFAELILQDCINRERIYVCTNLSFIPTHWNGKREIFTVDVGAAAERAVKKATEPPKKASKEKELSAEINPPKERNEKYYRPAIKISIPIPDNIVGVCRTLQDKIFHQLADTTQFLREWSGALFFIGIAFFAVVLGFMFSYNVGNSQQLLKELASKFSNQPTQVASTNTVQTFKPDVVQPRSDSEGDKEEQIPNQEANSPAAPQELAEAAPPSSEAGEEQSMVVNSAEEVANEQLPVESQPEHLQENEIPITIPPLSIDQLLTLLGLPLSEEIETPYSQ